MIPTKSQYTHQKNKVTESRYYCVNTISLFIYSLKSNDLKQIYRTHFECPRVPRRRVVR